MGEPMAESNEKLRELVAEVAAAYFSGSTVEPDQITTVILQIASSLRSIDAADSLTAEIAAAPPQKATPAQIRKSITPDAIISFEDGKPYKALKRHLTVKGLTPMGYRNKWGLPKDYPLTAPNYSAQRSQLALSRGLGRKGPSEPAPVKRGRAKLSPST